MIRNITPIIIFILLIFLAFNRESATKVKSSNTPGFSAENAFEYLKEIAKEPHPIGSLENKKVKEYLVKTLRAEGLQAEVQSGYVKSSWKPSYLKMAYVENVVAVLKGTDPNAKKVVISCHYDSVMEGPGAADDGYAVACAIETVKLLKKENRKSDLVLLITDGEEYGLLGAHLYAAKTDLSEIGVMLNYEARGNEGPGIAFEWSDNNAWLVDEMSKAYKRPIANSLSYEVYKRMSNASDFTIFRRKDVPGINHAFIDGFSYYHHPQDNLQNISKESIQHTGENMYLAAKHFTNYEFKEEKKRNATFFNFFGIFINYGSDLDLLLFALAMLMAVLLLTVYKRQKLTSTKGSLISILGIFGTLILSSGLCFGLTQILKQAYPQYSTFYAHHYYNHEWYLIAGVGLTLIVCWLIGRLLLKNYGSENLGVAVILLLNLLASGLYVEAQSATYLMMYPLATISAGLLLQNKFQSNKKPWVGFAIGVITLSILIGFWAVFSHSIYLAFSLNILAAAIIPTALFCFASYALLPNLWKGSKIVAVFGAGLFLFALGAAHAQSNATVDRPLKSNLYYTYSSENDQTSVATFDDYINDGHLGLIDENTKINLAKHMPYYNFASASDVDLSAYKSELSDSTEVGDKSSKTTTLTHPKHASMTHIYIPEITNVDSLFVNNELNKAFKDGATGSFYSPMYGFGLDTMEVRLVNRDTSVRSKVYVNIQYRDMPSKENLPENVVRNDGKIVISTMLEF